MSLSTEIIVTSDPGIDFVPADTHTELFHSFRSFYSADKLPSRIVFWIEKSGSVFLLRLVKSLGRKHKREDHVIGQVPGDLSSVKRAIGNFVSGNVLTCVRFEIYLDFELTELVHSGRFDYFELHDSLEENPKNSILGDWDFDCIVLTHRCVHCGKAGNLDSVLFVPEWVCKICLETTDFQKSLPVVKEMLSKLVDVEKRLPIFPAADTKSTLPKELNVVSNSLVFWYLQNQHLNGSSGWSSSNRDFSGQMKESVLPQSLFFALKSEEFRCDFVKRFAFEDYKQKWGAAFIQQISSFGQYLSLETFADRVSFERNLDFEFLKFEFSYFFNSLILNNNI